MDWNKLVGALSRGEVSASFTYTFKDGRVLTEGTIRSARIDDGIIIFRLEGKPGSVHVGYRTSPIKQVGENVFRFDVSYVGYGTVTLHPAPAGEA